MEKKLSHLDNEGRARMVRVSGKEETARRAVATGVIRVRPEILRDIGEGTIPKGDVLAVARLAGILAAKKTPELIPLCHPLRIQGVEVDLVLEPETGQIRATAAVEARDQTGVEMEALTAVSVALLGIYDMCKSLDKSMTIGEICLLEKTGGKSGTYRRPLAGEVVAVCRSDRKGVAKECVDRVLLVAGHGVEGDAHAGDGDRQVSLLGEESIGKMRERGLELVCGDFGENVVIRGIPLHTLPLGTRLKLGPEALGEVTQIGKECHAGCAIARKVGDCIMPREGVFVRIREGGPLQAGDPVEVLW